MLKLLLSGQSFVDAVARSKSPRPSVQDNTKYPGAWLMLYPWWDTTGGVTLHDVSFIICICLDSVGNDKLRINSVFEAMVSLPRSMASSLLALPRSWHDLGKDTMAMQDRAKTNHDLGQGRAPW